MARWLARSLLSLASMSILMGMTMNPALGSEPTSRVAVQQTATAQLRTRYEISATYQPEISQVSGTVKVLIPRHHLEAQGQDLYFRLPPNKPADTAQGVQMALGPATTKQGSLAVDHLRVDGQPVQAIMGEDPTLLRILLPQVAQGERSPTLGVEMEYVLKLPEAESGLRQTDTSAFLAQWYPVLAVRDARGWHVGPYARVPEPAYTRVADYQVSLHVPPGYRVVSTAVDPAAPVQSVTLTQPCVRDFVLWLTKEHNLLRSSWQHGVQIKLWYPPEMAKLAPAIHQTALSSVAFFSQKIGPYPYQELDLILERTRQGISGKEHPALVGLRLPQTEPGSQRYRNAIQKLVAHEIAHEWWYGIVGNDQGQEPWLDEGLATFSTTLYLQAHRGSRGKSERVRMRYLAKEEKEMTSFLRAVAAAPVQPSMAEPLPPYPRINAFNAYILPPLMLTELARKLGSLAKVEKILRLYYERYRYDIASPADFTQLVSSEAGVDLTAFFQRWLYAKNPLQIPSQAKEASSR